MVTSALVVPDKAESTTRAGSDCLFKSDAMCFMRSGLPTLVPPNFITFMIVRCGCFVFLIKIGLQIYVAIVYKHCREIRAEVALNSSRRKTKGVHTAVMQNILSSGQ